MSDPKNHSLKGFLNGAFMSHHALHTKKRQVNLSLIGNVTQF